jgi:hypothetical protein
MSTNTILRVETRTDFLGEYTAYVYSDGHIETSPADRPVYKEDYQRKRAIELSQQNARTAMAAARTARATGRGHLNREQVGASATAAMLDSMRSTLTILNEVVASSTSNPSALNVLVTTVDIGGALVYEGADEGFPTEPTADRNLR